jgi:hypothetical protein
MLSCGLSPGSSRLALSVANDQFRCLPLPLMPANGFSCSSATSPYFRAILQHHHQQVLMVCRDVRILVDRRHLELARCHFVVPRLDRHTQSVQLALDFHHAGEHAVLDGAEVVIFQLLATRRLRAEQRAARRHQVRTAVVELLIDQEVLLLRPERRHHAARIHAEQLERAPSLHIECMNGAQQRDLRIERVTSPRRERCGNRQVRALRPFNQKRRRGRVPGGVPRASNVAQSTDGNEDASGSPESDPCH